MLEFYLDKFEFHPDSLDEFRLARTRFETQSPGLSDRFSFEVAEALQDILDFPESGKTVPEVPSVRQYLTRVFPFYIVYLKHISGIKIFAISHQHRDRTYWMKRID